MAKIVLKKLKKGNRILLETLECVFDIELVAPTKGKVYIVGGKRFLDKTVANIVGAYGARSKDGEEKLQSPFEIERGIGVQMSYKDEDGTLVEFITSPVVSGKLTGRADGKVWEYEIWPDDERRKKMEQAVYDARNRLRVHHEDTES